MSNQNNLQPSRASPMGPLYNPQTGRLTKCKVCGCEWGIRDMLIPTNADPYSILGSRILMTTPTHIQCGLCGRTLE